MATYGITIYGTDYYGPSNLQGYLVNMTTTPRVGGGVTLSWPTPGNQWSHMRLVRNAFGYPATADDGTVLFEINSGPNATGTIDAPLNKYDDPSVPAPRFYYYSLFVMNLVANSYHWVRCADAIGQAVAEHNYGRLLLQRIPSIFTTPQGSVDEAPAPGTAVSRFLSVFGADGNRIRDFLDHLNLVEDPDLAHGNLLKYLVEQWGHTYEPAIGMRQNRVLAKNATFIHQAKGTWVGMQALASAVTGYGAEQLQILNWMLDHNDSSFEESIGNWQVTKGLADLEVTAAISPVDGTNMLSVTCLSTGQVNLSTAGYGTYGSGTYGGMNPMYGGAMSALSMAGQNQGQYGSGAYGDGFYGGVSTQAMGFGIPVMGIGSMYGGPPAYGLGQYGGTGPWTVSAYFRSNSTVVSPAIDIEWYDMDGVYLSTTKGTGSATSTSAWTRISTTEMMPPMNAGYLVPVIRYPSLTNGDVQFVDAVQVEQGGSATTYTKARLLELLMVAPRVNEVLNGGFDTDVNNWSATSATLAWDSTTTYNSGLGSCKVTPSVAGFAVTSLDFPVDAGSPLTVSAEFRPLTTSTQIQLYVQWFDSTYTLIGSTTGTTATVPGNTWQRISTTTTVPSKAAYAAVTVQQVGGTTTQFWIDDVLVEETSVVKTYFDNRLNGADAVWEATPNASRLHLYPNYMARKQRLADMMTDHVPLGADFAILYAQPRTIGVYSNTYGYFY